ncbi:MAG: hypothetical protein ABSH51_10110, partial [Solirubrobacteraceae bacterium]
MPVTFDRAAPRRESSEPAGAGGRGATTLPLAALRHRLDHGSAAAHWSMNPDGVIGRALLMASGATVTFPLALSGDVSFAARVMLLPHDWRDGRGAVRASVAVTDAAGRRREVWSGALRAGSRGRPRGRAVDCRLPASTTAVALTLHAGVHQYRAVARAIWVEPAITDPAMTPRNASPARRAPAAQLADPPVISVLT